jgi:transcription initiation factor TFIIIB Brf1 subunit/transcription initiation factor TFIIB
VEGRSPLSVAAGAIYLICAAAPETARTLKQVAEVSLTSECNLRGLYKDALRPARIKLFSEEYAEALRNAGQSLDNLPM